MQQLLGNLTTVNPFNTINKDTVVTWIKYDINNVSNEFCSSDKDYMAVTLLFVQK